MKSKHTEYALRRQLTQNYLKDNSANISLKLDTAMVYPTPLNANTSALMKRVRRSGTDAELRVGKLLSALGARYRKNVSSLPGSPDFANQARSWAIFVHGCFWHAHRGCSRARLPRHNREYWALKLETNQKRDLRKLRELRSRGFSVITVWQCELSNQEKLLRRLARFLEAAMLVDKS